MGPTVTAEEESRMQRQYVTNQALRGADAFFEKREPPITKAECIACEHPVMHHAYAIDGDY